MTVKEFARCPHPECNAAIPVPRHLVDGGTKLCRCPCRSIQVVPVRDRDGRVVLRRVAQLGGRTLRKGDRVLVRHSYQSVHGPGAGEWYSIETISRGGKSPRDEHGAPLNLARVVGVIEEIDG